jgi:hypothetical protein
LTKNYAGIGSSTNETEIGRQAIRDVYQKTFTQPAAQPTEVKEGVQDIFNSNPELASIGTPEQYSAYLDTIFPDSKVKDIVYHQGKEDFEKFDLSKSTESPVIYFSYYKPTTSIFGDKTKSLILNFKNPFIEKDSLQYDSLEQTYKDKFVEEGYDAIITPNEIGVAFEPEQIHILGNKEDIDGFKQFVSETPSQPTELTEDDFDLKLTDRITILENNLANLEDTKRVLMENSVPVLIASNLPKIKPDSARRETGVKVGTAKDINPGMLSNNGVSVERAAEILNEDLFYEGSGFPEVDVQDIRNYIIDILQTGVKNFIDDYVGQDKIDNVKAEIEALREEQRLSKEGNTGIQLNIFDQENAPEGLPPINRTSEECE